jgi:mono/diheme cytochrome c family protein
MAIQSNRRRQRLVLSLFVSFILAIAACNDGGSKKNLPVSNEPGGKPDPVLVKKLYDAKCAICHGFDGRQQYAGAKDISASTMTRDQIIQQIAEGKGSMPPQKDVLDTDQIAALADFVLALQGK